MEDSKTVVSVTFCLAFKITTGVMWQNPVSETSEKTDSLNLSPWQL